MVSDSRKIIFLDLKKQLSSIKEEIDQTVKRVLHSGKYVEGPEVGAFESTFSRCHEADFCIAVSSGTAAIHIVLLAHDIGPGDEVILPANTCFPTAEAVCLTGANPVFVDCEDVYYNIDPEKIQTAITSNTKAIIAVHLYGQPAQMNKIKKIANRHGLHLMEDCAQAHLSSYHKAPVGSFGIAGAFSFYPTKNLGAYGEGGAVVTNDQQLADKIRALKNHGSTTKNIHEFIGHNYRMDSLQAAVLSIKLRYLNQWTETRRQNALLYHKYLSNLDGLILPNQHPEARHVFHLYVVRSAKRDKLRKYLLRCGIETAIHYPLPCHLQPALRYLSFKEKSFPVSEKLAKEVLSLPISEQLSENDIDYISNCIKEFIKR